MIANERKTMTFSASSNVDVEGTETNVATFSATLNEYNKLNFAKSINNLELYKTRREEIDADYEAWQNKVIEEAIGE